MITAYVRRSLGKATRLGVFGTLGLLLACVTASAQPAQELVKGRTLVRSGYTRPGTPNDVIGGKGEPINIYASDKWDQKFLGGTVYFAVYERTGAEGDTWNTGMAGFDEAFVEGRSHKGKFSPTLDLKARYLYLYQVVNDRGLDPSKNRVNFAANMAANPAQPIVSSSVRLMVDPRYITSWGYFKHTGFASTVPDLKLSGDVAVAGAEAKLSKIAFSSNPSILSELPYKGYQRRAPANPLGDLRKGFGVNLDTVGLKTAAATKEIEAVAGKDNAKLAAWQKNMLESSKSAKEPAIVELLYAASGDTGTPLTTENGAVQAYFRADWQGDQTVQHGHHSMIFGFTTDLPPIDEEVRIYDKEGAKGGPIKAAAFAADGPGAPTTSAPGTVPTPEPMAAAAEAPVAGGASMGLMGGQTGGGGGGFPGFGGGAGFSRPGLSSGGGGGLGGGTGGGTGNGNSNATPTTSTNTDTASKTNPTQSINFNPTLINLQSQAQLQAQQQQQLQLQLQLQQQRQSQHNNNHGHHRHHGHHVVPAPAALLLGLFGLPALFFLRRRKPQPATLEA